MKAAQGWCGMVRHWTASQLRTAVLHQRGAMLALNEYLMREPLPLATVHEAIIDVCRGRSDVCLFGAQALNRHTGAPRMTQDVDIMAENPQHFADALATALQQRFPREMAIRVRVVRRGTKTLGYRVYQSRSEARGGNRHLADVRAFDVPRRHVTKTDGVQYTDAKLTIAMKAIAAAVRTNRAKRLQDLADLARLVVAMPEVTAEELEPLWVELQAPQSARSVFEEMRSSGSLAAETDEDSFY